MPDDLTTPAAPVIAAAEASPVTASPSARTITGRVVPFGPAGQTSQGRLTFAAGSLRWTEPKRVKLLLEHDQRQTVGFATDLEERPDGLYATFSVPEHTLGDSALMEASHGLRDAFSVGVQLDDAAQTKLRRAQGAPTPGTGALREVSLVSVPAFDDARVDSVAASNGALVVSSWTTASEQPGPTVPLHEPSDPPAIHGPDDPATQGEPMPDTVEPDAPTAPVIPTQPVPEVVQAAAGAALVTAEAATYSFTGRGPSLARDAIYAKDDPDAAARLARFNAQLATGDAAQTMALAAVATRSDLAELVNPELRRPDLLLSAINEQRHVWSRLSPITVKDSQPFRIPVAGEFTGVGPHTEGTAHVAEGTMTFSDVVITPRAVSGAFRLSRELVDSSNPAADQMVIAAMLEDYARVSEDLAVAGLVAGAGAAILNVDTVNELSAQLIAYRIANRYPPAIVIAGGGFFTALANDLDTTNRSQLSSVGSTNAVGAMNADGVSAVVRGVPVVLGDSVASAEAFILPGRSGAIVGESPVQTFRFDQPEGPGIIKLALFAYQVAAVTRAGSVVRLTTAAA